MSSSEQNMEARGGDTPGHRAPCRVCKRFHRGPRCKPRDQLSVRVCLTVPGRVMARLRAAVPWGERSAWLAQLIERELDRQEARS